jgi:crotonobetainyl-CoA:carnitine CoA-transferase CaiB-like acyl-CoA transferase
MSIGGTSDREPLKRGLRASWYEAGMTAAYVAILGHFASLEGRGGSLIDVSVAECLSAELVTTQPAYSFVGGVPGRRRRLQDPLASGQPLPARDGFVSLQVNSLTPMRAFGELLGQPLLGGEQFATHEGRLAHAEELDHILRASLRDETMRAFFVRASEAGLLTGMVQPPEQLLSCPHLDARSAWVTMPGTLGGHPWRMPAPAGGIVRGRAPRLGQHDAMLDARAAVAR